MYDRVQRLVLVFEKHLFYARTPSKKCTMLCFSWYRAHHYYYYCERLIFVGIVFARATFLLKRRESIGDRHFARAPCQMLDIKHIV